MKLYSMIAFLIPFSSLCWAECPPCTNQTSHLSEPLKQRPLPYRVTLKQADFELPAGLHSFAFAVHDGEWLLIAGRTNGLHNVDNSDSGDNPFPPSQQNTQVFVVNPEKKTIWQRSLDDHTSHLSQSQIDLLSVTNSLFFYEVNKKTLYLAGGYGLDTASKIMGTKPALTAIDVPHLIQWVKHPHHSKSAAKCIRTLYHPIFQLTGGEMVHADKDAPFLLAFGQNFSGNYTFDSNGSYSEQIRPVKIVDDGHKLSVKLYRQPPPDPNYRRRDLNVIPVIKKRGDSLKPAFVALSGVFTPGNNGSPGAWTVPIEINPDGSSHMLDPDSDKTLAQAMNNYSSANVGLYSRKKDRMYTLLFGGISAAIFSDGSNCNTDSNPQCNSCTGWIRPPGNIFTPCCNLPFTNDVTSIEIDSHGRYRQYLMKGAFPTIESHPPECPGFPPMTCSEDPLSTIYYFGANAAFIPAVGLPTFPNGVIALDKLEKKSVLIGYIVGGIASTIEDTNCTTDTIASHYIFEVRIKPH